ncbi:MAG: hypothetical protein OXC30_05835 [Alphaproteobacteria bacterium]|nr:hypothetical protein [Alphaproteobacteria bacterium]
MKKYFFLIILLMNPPAFLEAKDFVGLRIATKINVTSFSVFPKKISNPPSAWVPGASVHAYLGGLKGEGVYYGGHAFACVERGVSEKSSWTLIPSHCWGGGLVTGAIVQKTFLTSFGLGCLQSIFSMKSPQGKKYNQEMFFGYVEIMTESLLTGALSSEVSYRYAFALSENAHQSKAIFEKRAAMHTFSVGIILHL